MSFRLPEPAALGRMLGLILGAEAGASEVAEDATDGAFHGVFADDAGEVVALASCDLASAAALGCALSMIPPGGAEAMVEDGELSANASANLYEVMNMFSSLFMDDRTDHLRLIRVDPGDAPALSRDEKGRRDLAFTLGKYGRGRIAFRTC